jgi:hypothetical protein
MVAQPIAPAAQRCQASLRMNLVTCQMTSAESKPGGHRQPHDSERQSDSEHGHQDQCEERMAVGEPARVDGRLLPVSVI